MIQINLLVHSALEELLFESSASFFGGADLRMQIRYANGTMSDDRAVWTGMAFKCEIKEIK